MAGQPPCIGWRFLRQFRRRAMRTPLVQLLATALAAALLPSFAQAAPARPVRRVLVLNVLGPLSSPGVAVMDQAIVDALERSPFQIELYTEDLEATLFPDAASQRHFREWYIRKYRDRKPDVILAVGLEPLKFMVEAHEASFPGVPIIFCGSTEEMLSQLKLDSHFTGVWGVAHPEETLNVALRLLPRTRHVVVVSGVGEYDRHLVDIARAVFRKHESNLDFTYLTDLDMPVLLERLRRLPDHSIVYHTSIMQDASGTRFIDATQSVPLLVGAANAPIFVVDDVDVGRGTVGGYVLSFAAEGRIAGEMAVRVLNGQRPEDIPIVKSANVYMFDWRAMRRWGLKETDLPAGSIVLHREPGVWESYKWYIIGGVALILLETLLILGLAWQRAKRRQTEHRLRESREQLAGIVGSAMDAIIAIDEEQRIVLFNAAAEKMFGCAAREAMGGGVDRFIPQRFRAQHSAHIRRFGESSGTARAMGAPGALWAVRPDGREFPIEASISHVDADGKKLFTVIVRDITERLQALQAVRESEERFRLVANTAPVLIWMSGPDGLCTYFNQPWLEFTGRAMAEELGNRWTDGVHPDDRTCCMDTHTRAFERRESFNRQYRLRRHDGEYRWVSDIGVPRFGPEGSFAGYIGSCIDVTERKLAEEALADMGRRLLEAHEEERAWIARELHDDINQRIVLMTLELEQWNQQLPDSASERQAHIRLACRQLSDLGRDIQALSHRLHSSKLEYLGIVAAAGSFCKELSENRNIQIDFIHSDIPDNVPKEVSLCLFRVLQEALQNAAKHSGKAHFSVELHGASGEIHLSVSDSGLGFDPARAILGKGLGLISMQERVRLVRGELSIESGPMGGTTIRVRAPLQG